MIELRMLPPATWTRWQLPLVLNLGMRRHIPKVVIKNMSRLTPQEP